jgi:GNAT superfamily N-acetyltransferase
MFMHTIRLAARADAATIARQRVKMFQDNSLICAGSWEDLERDSAQWTANKIGDGSYVGWLVEERANDGSEESAVIGGAGVWFMEWPPHFMHLEPVRGYLLNFYVAPNARGRGIAKELVGLAVEECRRRGVHVATLHASAMGRPVYESLGWKASNEMMFRALEKPLSPADDHSS